MKKIPKLFLLFSLILLIHNCASYTATSPMPQVTTSPHFRPDEFDRLVVIVSDQTRKFHRSGALRQVEDEFMKVVIQRGYTLVSRSDIDKIIDELNFQRSSLTEQQVARIGHLLNVPAIILVSINNVTTQRYQPIISIRGKNYYFTLVNISARLISTEKGEVLWISSYTGKYQVQNQSRDVESQALAPVAKVVASGLPSFYSKNRIR